MFGSSEEINWNWLHIRDNESGSMGDRRSEGCNPLPGQHVGKLLDESTLRTDVKFQRMRSCSVTLGRNKAANSATRARQMERSYSIGVMASSNSEKLTQSRRCEREDDAVRRSWMRASMRLVRPFHLADPPSPPSQRPNEPVQIHLPPVFPCDVELPCSAPMPERPRQYGRSGQRRMSSRISSVSSESPASSFSAENWDNTDSGIVDSGVSRTESERSNSQVPRMSRNESVSSTTTQSTTRSAPAPSTG